MAWAIRTLIKDLEIHYGKSNDKLPMGSPLETSLRNWRSDLTRVVDV